MMDLLTLFGVWIRYTMNNDPKLVNIPMHVFVSQLSIWYQFSEMIWIVIVNNRFKLWKHYSHILIFHIRVNRNTTPGDFWYSSWVSSSFIVGVLLVVNEMLRSNLFFDSVVGFISLSARNLVTFKLNYLNRFFIYLNTIL